eukprot:12797273-Alexandrium_andersonii.AAC.1
MQPLLRGERAGPGGEVLGALPQRAEEILRPPPARASDHEVLQVVQALRHLRQHEERREAGIVTSPKPPALQ